MKKFFAEKAPKTYYELSKENKRLKRGYAGMAGLYLLGAMLFMFSFMIETATVGNYVLSKLQPTTQSKYNIPNDRTSTWEWSSSGDWIIINNGIISSREILAKGECVDKAQTIINMLKRRYISFNRIKAAISDNHVQVVRQNIDGTIDFLKLEDRNIVTGDSEFTTGFNKLIDPDDFLAAVEYFKPDINVWELQAYLDNKYKTEKQ